MCLIQKARLFPAGLFGRLLSKWRQLQILEENLPGVDTRRGFGSAKMFFEKVQVAGQNPCEYPLQAIHESPGVDTRRGFGFAKIFFPKSSNHRPKPLRVSTPGDPSND